jgi:hypothetical protein
MEMRDWSNGMLRQFLISISVIFGMRKRGRYRRNWTSCLVEALVLIMQNSQPSTTLDLYTHAFDKNKETASEKLQKKPEILTKIQKKTVHSHNNAA